MVSVPTAPTFRERCASGSFNNFNTRLLFRATQADDNLLRSSRASGPKMGLELFQNAGRSRWGRRGDPSAMRLVDYYRVIR
jgi:hypothetical protein